MPTLRRTLVHAVVPLVLAAALATSSILPAGASAPGAAPIRGTVVAADTGRPVPGARVVVPAAGLAATTDDGGGFVIPAVPAGVPYRRIEVAVHAGGFG